tara:strand:+ start:1175 stop:2077 length:903 start_codon:yes stop_codon:yes gene_type:complete
MSTFYTHQHKNKYKTWLLMAGFLGLIVGIGWFLSYYYDSPNILYIAILVSIVMNVWAYWFSHKTVITMTGAKEVDFNQAPELHRIVENLSITAGLPKPKVYIIQDQAPNAFATGRNKHHAVVAVTTGLLEILDKDELEGVIAHELGHIGNNDMLVSTVAVILVGVITMVSDLLLRGTLFGGRGGDNNNGNAFVLIIGIVLMVLTPIIASVMRFAISRKRELLADATGAMLTRYPEGLARALEKIHNYGSKMKSANHATAHLFIANPFGLKRAATYINRLFLTHPPAEVRTKLLREMDSGK